MKLVTFTRAEFLKLIWSDQFTNLSKKYDVTPQILKETCKDYNIPIPPPDYWDSIRAGSKIKTPVLPESNHPDKEIKFFIWEESDESNTDIQESIEKVRAEIESHGDLPSFSEKFINPDQLVLAARKTLQEKAKERWRDRGLISTHRGELDIKVSPQNVDRSLRFIDTVIKLLRRRGGDVIVSDTSTYAIIEGEKLKILFRERTQKEEKVDKWGGHDYQPTGKLTLKVDDYPRIEWVDGLEKLEEQLPKIIYKLTLKGKREKEQSLYHKKEREKQDEINRRAAEVQRTKEEELNSFLQLLNQARRYSQAQLIREYIDAVKRNGSIEGKDGDELYSWIEWARKKADWFDPLINLKDDLLEEVDADVILKHHVSKNLTDFSWGDFSGDSFNYFKNKNRYR